MCCSVWVILERHQHSKWCKCTKTDTIPTETLSPVHTRTHTLRHSYTQSSITAGLFSIPNIHCLATTYQETSSPPDQSSLPLKGSQSGELLPWDKLVWSRKKGWELVNMVSMSPAEISFPFPLSSFSLCFNAPLTQLSMSKHSNLILISPAPLFRPLTVCRWHFLTLKLKPILQIYCLRQSHSRLQCIYVFVSVSWKTDQE